MPAIGLRTHKLSIERLKGIRGLDEISFEDKPITGIFGPNGVGKSTILYALAAAYNAPNGCTAEHYKRFFPPLANDIWNGTKFVVNHTYKSGPEANAVTATGEVQYRKGQVTTQWIPTVNRRPERHVTFIGVKSCLPDLEIHSSHDLTGATVTPRTTADDRRIREAAGAILNCTYSEIGSLAIPGSPSRQYTSLTRQDLGGQSYPSVVMGAGEQRLIRLLYAIETTRKNGLILIDEFDLLFHGDALKKLVTYLSKRCADREQQLVFTSHREELLSLKDEINIRHIHYRAGRHYCLPETDPDSLHRLTGNRVRPVEVFVEDDVAEAITSHLASELGMSRHVRIVKFGSASNAFSVCAGLLMQGENIENSLFVLDGDVFLDAAQRESERKRACNGNDPVSVERRAKMETQIKDYILPASAKPEPYLHHLICGQNADQMTPMELEIAMAAAEIVNPPDRHGFINHLVNTLGENRAVQLTRVIPLAAKHPDWAAYTQPVRDWLVARKAALNL